MDLSNFGNPWEHIRLLSDADRNAAMIGLLERQAPGRRVLEVGCGTGLLSCIAARLGATQVLAVEPTPLWRVAEELVRANGLGEVVKVLPGRVEDLTPQPVDVAFSELLNADPLAEGILSAMSAAARWLAPGGQLLPRRLQVFGALVRGDSAETRVAHRELRQMSQRYNLRLDPLHEALREGPPSHAVVNGVALASEPALLFDLDLSHPHDLDGCYEHRLVCHEPGPVSGAVVWSRALLDGDHAMETSPDSHWGVLQQTWLTEVAVPMNARPRLQVVVRGTELTLRWGGL